MEKIDYALINEILNELKGIYPSSASPNQLKCYKNHKDFNDTLFYLKQHNLVECIDLSDTGIFEIIDIKINHRGIDYIAPDGGLTSKLNKITVEFDNVFIKELFINKLEKDKAPPDKIHKAKELIQNLSIEGLKHLCTQLLTVGVDKIPNVFDLIQKI